MVTNPFTSPTSAPVATTATATATVADPASKKARKPSNRRKTSEDIKFILENYSSMNTSEIAQKLDLTRQQVYRTVIDTRKKLEADLETCEPDKKAKINQFLEQKLPNKPFGGGTSGPRRNPIDDVVSELLG